MLIQDVNEANVAINLSWDKDGLDGEHYSVKSMVVLLEWWTSGNNYSKYRGKDNKGKKKKDVYFKLATSINHISRCERTANSVKCKIIGLESSWKMAHDWAGATGQGVKENEGVESFDAGVMQYCKYYFYLHDIMVDRCSSRPLANSEDFYFPDEASLGYNSSSESSVSSGEDFVEDRPKKKEKNGKKTNTITPTKIIQGNDFLTTLTGKPSKFWMVVII